MIGHGELTDDGQWHVHVSPVSLANVGIIAIQVQAAQNDAFLEVAELRLTDRKPVVRLADTFEATPGWPTQMDNWRPVALPPGNLPGEQIADLLHVEGWIGAGHFTVGGVPVQVGDGKDAAIATAKDEPATVVVPLAGQASEAYLLLAAEFPRTDEPSYGGSGSVVRHVHRFVARIEYTDGSAEEQFPLAVNARRHAISRGLHMYALALAPGRACGSCRFSIECRGRYSHWRH